MRFPVRPMLFVVALLLLPSVAQAQLFPRLFPALRSNAVSSSCPGGVCPTGMSTANTNPGHWTYPGTITNHLESAHGVSTQGLSRQEQLNLHDSLHEGGSVVRSVPGHSPQATTYYYYPSQTAQGGGSTGSVKSGGSTGSLGYESTGSSTGTSVVASDSVTVLKLGSRRDFKRNLMAAAKQAVANEKITQEQYDALNFAIKFPGVAQKLEAALHETAIENGLASAQAIDWDKLIEFIERMIPIILKLIDLFSYNQPTLDTQYVYQTPTYYQLAA